MDLINDLLSWVYFHGKTMEELRYALVYTILELEQTKLVAEEELRERDEQLIHLEDVVTETLKDTDVAVEKCQQLLFNNLLLQQKQLVVEEELRKRDEQLIHLEDVLTKTLKERDEAVEKCQHLLLSNLLLQHNQKQEHIAPPLSGASSIIEDEQLQPQQLSNKSFSSSDTEETIMSPSVTDPVIMNKQNEVSGAEMMATLLPEKPLPEKGKLLQAVLKAGPLLQSLLLAGPLPQWRHPPPLLETSEIPPVTAPPPQFQNNGCGNSNKKR